MASSSRSAIGNSAGQQAPRAAPPLPPTHIRVTLATTSGTSWDLHLHRETDVAQLKAFVATHLHIAVEQQNLLFGGRTLGDGKMCADFGVTDGSTVFLVPTMQSGPMRRETSPSQAAAAPTTASAQSSELISRGLQMLTEEQIASLLSRTTPSVITVHVDDHVVVFTVMPKERCTTVAATTAPAYASASVTSAAEAVVALESMPPQDAAAPLASLGIHPRQLTPAPAAVGDASMEHWRAVVPEPTENEMRAKVEAVRAQLRLQQFKRSASTLALSAVDLAQAPSAEAACKAATPSTAPSGAPPALPKRSKADSRSSDHCHKCSKRLGLTSRIMCRCGGHFCAQHRHAEDHACSFDYKTAERRRLADENPIVAASKLNHI